MFRFSYAAKVGLIFLVGIVLFFMVMDVLGIPVLKRKITKGYYLTIVFESSKGLKKGDEVQLNGVNKGEVDDIKGTSFGEVEVLVRILDDTYIIHTNADFTIAKTSIFGSTVVYINEPRSGSFIARGQENNNTITIKMPAAQATLQSDVIYNGEAIGRVVDIVRNPDNNMSDTVTIDLTPGFDKEITMEQSFVATRKRVKAVSIPGATAPEKEIVVGQINVYDPLNNGDVVHGYREPGPEDLVVNANNLIQSASGAIEGVSTSLSELAINLNTVLVDLSNELTGGGPGTIKGEIIVAIQKLQSGLQNVETLTSNLNKLMLDSQPKFEDILADVKGTTGEIHQAASDLGDVISDPELAASIKASVSNIEAATAEVRRTIEEIEGLVTDDKVQDDLKGVLAEARQALDKTNTLLDDAKAVVVTISATESEGEFRVRYLTKPEHIASDFEYSVSPGGGNLFYRMGVEDIGSSDDLSFQLGYNAGNGWLGRAGIKRGQIGAGFDYDANDLLLRADLYNPNDLHFNIYGGYAISDDFRFIIGFEDIYNEDFFNLGISTEF